MMGAMMLGWSLACLQGARAQEASDATTNASPHIGKMFVQTIPAQRYVYGSFATTFGSMGTPVVQTLMSLGKTAVQQKVGLHGPVVDVYYQAPHRTPDQEFKMEIGYFLRDPADSVGEFKVRELPKFKCASLIYVGQVTGVGDAWQAVYRELNAAGLKPTDEERELYLYYEAVDSPNNVVQVQVGVE
jgi:effector-binding domain-containing protein